MEFTMVGCVDENGDLFSTEYFDEYFQANWPSKIKKINWRYGYPEFYFE